MTLEKVQLPAEVEAQLQQLASSTGVSVEEFVADAICSKVDQLARWQEIRQRVGKVTREEFLAALAQSPDVPPIPGDELPEGWTGLKK